MKYICVFAIWAALIIFSACTPKSEPARPVEKPAAVQEAVTTTPKPRMTPTPEPTVGGDLAIFFFARNCARCHGTRREGGLGGRAPSLTPERLTQSDDFYMKTIKEGRPGTPMPAHKDLSDADLAALVKFLKQSRP